MHGGVAAGAPASALAHKGGVINLADEQAAGRALRLRVAFEAEVGVALDEQFVVNRAVRVVTHDAAFTHGLVLENKRPRLIAMAGGTGLVQLRHCQSAGGFHDVVPMRVVALDAVHLAFDDGMMMRQAEFGVRANMAAEAGFGGFAGIDDELVAALPAGLDVLAGGAVAGLATVLGGFTGRADEDTGMRAGGKLLCDGRMAVGTGLVAGKGRAFDVQRLDHRARDGGAGTKNGKRRAQRYERGQRNVAGSGKARPRWGCAKPLVAWLHAPSVFSGPVRGKACPVTLLGDL